MGAHLAFLGRSLLYAMAAGGERGLHRLWEVMREDISLTLAQPERRDSLRRAA